MKKIIVIGMLAMLMLTGCGKEAPKATISKPGAENTITETTLTENVTTWDNADITSW